jgi:phage tail sheath protein FI
MDSLDDVQINPIIVDPGWGIVVFGEDTEQSKKSALSNVHVRRLINQIAVSTTRAAKGYLFEPLLDRTYFRVRMTMEQYLAELEGLGAFDNVNDRGWKVVCDATNNPASVRDLNELHVWLFIKPVRVAKYIEIKAIITRSTASFEAAIASGVAG